MDEDRSDRIAAAGAILGTSGLTATVDAALDEIIGADKRRRLLALVKSGKLDFDAMVREDT